MSGYTYYFAIIKGEFVDFFPENEATILDFTSAVPSQYDRTNKIKGTKSNQAETRHNPDECGQTPVPKLQCGHIGQSQGDQNIKKPASAPGEQVIYQDVQQGHRGHTDAENTDQFHRHLGALREKQSQNQPGEKHAD